MGLGGFLHSKVSLKTLRDLGHWEGEVIDLSL